MVILCSFCICAPRLAGQSFATLGLVCGRSLTSFVEIKVVKLYPHVDEMYAKKKGSVAASRCDSLLFMVLHCNLHSNTMLWSWTRQFSAVNFSACVLTSTYL